MLSIVSICTPSRDETMRIDDGKVYREDLRRLLAEFLASRQGAVLSLTPNLPRAAAAV